MERFSCLPLPSQEFHEAKIRWYDQRHMSNFLSIFKRIAVFFHCGTWIRAISQDSFQHVDSEPVGIGADAPLPGTKNHLPQFILVQLYRFALAGKS